MLGFPGAFRLNATVPGGILLSPNGVWRVLRRHGLSTRAKRYGLVPATPSTRAAAADPSA